MDEDNESSKSYKDKLRISANETGSIVCMDLNPVMEAMPKFGDFRGKTRMFFEDIFDRMAEEKVFPGAFKIKPAVYEIHDEPWNYNFKGMDAIADMIKNIRERFPNIPIILDSQKNFSDIHNTLCGDAVTANPYNGADSDKPFADKDLGIYVSCLTPNLGSKDFQDLRVISSDDVYNHLENALLRANPKITSQEHFEMIVKTEIMPALRTSTKSLYMNVAEKIIEWSKDNQNIGAIVSAENQNNLRDITMSLSSYHRPILVQDADNQGKNIPMTLFTLNSIHYDIGLVRIDSPKGMMYPWETADKAPKDWDILVVQNLKKWNEKIGYVPK